MKSHYAAANSPPPAEGFLPGVANSKLIKHTHHDALRNPELAGVANGTFLFLFCLINRFFFVCMGIRNRNAVVVQFVCN